MSDAAAPAAAAPAAAPEVSVANHPRAVSAIRRTRARVALGAFALVLLLCLHAGVPGQAAVARALVAGVAGFLCAWLVGVALWRQIVLAEVRTAHAAHAARLARRRELLAAAAERRKAESERQS